MTATAKAHPWESPEAKAGKAAKPAELPSAEAPATAPEAPANSNFAGIVDEYATLDSQIKALEKRKKELGEQIKKMGVGEFPGTKCKAVITESTSTRLDTDAIKGAMPEDWITHFSKTSTTRTLNIKALV